MTITTFTRQVIFLTIEAACVTAILLSLVGLLSGDIETARSLIPYAIPAVIFGVIAEIVCGDFDRP